VLVLILAGIGAGLAGGPGGQTVDQPLLAERDQRLAGGPAEVGSGSPSLCAVPPAPGKTGFVASSRIGPPRHDRPFRHPGDHAFAPQLPDTIKTIAILVDFDDQPMDSTQAYFERVFLFMNQFWSQAALGELVIATTVSDSVYRLPETMEYYGNDELFEERQTLFIRDTILAADEEFDYTDFDVHICVHAGAGQEADVAGDSPEQLWSVFAPFEVLSFYLPDSTADQGILTNDFTSEGDPFYVQFSLVLPEVESQDFIPGTDPPIPYIFGMTGVYCHEFGHALGLPDLYDTTPETFPDSQGIGSFDVMASGTWNANGFVPGRPSAWSCFDAGFIDAEVIDRPGRVELAAVASDDAGGLPRLAAVMLGGDEYFLIENRVQDPNSNGLFDFNDMDEDSLFSFWVDDYEGAEFDFFLPGEGSGSGLLIWHIDPSTIEANFVFNTVEADATHKGVDLEEADGVQDMDGFPVSLDSFGSAADAFRLGNRTRFAPDTVPSTMSSFGIPSFVTIDSVSAVGQIMSFIVSFERRKEGWPVSIDGPIGGNHPAVADLNPAGDDGLESVWVDTTGGVWVVGADGSQPLGAPLATVGPDANTAPAIGDIDADGSPEVVVAAADGTIYAWNGEDGSEVLDGDLNPATSGVWAEVGRSLLGAIPVLAPIGGPGVGVVVGTPADSTGEGEVVWCQQSGTEVQLDRVLVPGDATTPPLVFSGKGPVILAAATAEQETRFFAIEPGIPPPVERELTHPGRLAAVRAMVAGDLDGDGLIELIVSDSRGRIDAYTTSLTVGGDPVLDELSAVPGWPFDLDLEVAHDLALGDIDQDGRHEVLLSAFDGRLYAVNFNGTPQLFFPLTAGDPDRPLPRVVPSPLAVDLAGDASPEVIFAPGDGRAFAVDGAGRTLPGWPLPGPASKGAVPVIDDLDKDGNLDLVVPSDLAAGSSLIAYELGVAEGPGSVWRAYRGGADHRGILTAAADTPAPQSFLSEIYVYPNPVDGEVANIHFSLGADALVEVEILDSIGRLVARPLAPALVPGRTDHEVRWDVSDAASGVYLVRLSAEGQGEQEVELEPFAVRR
jgi:M6 family metalloprotease-like protein